MQIAIVEYAAARRDLKGALLLPGGTFHKILMMNYLQPDQPAADQNDPAGEEQRDMQQAEATMHRAGGNRARGGIARPLGLLMSAL